MAKTQSTINPYARLIESCGGLDNIEKLQTHKKEDIYEKAVKILEDFFAAEEEDQNVAPNQNLGASTFQFGATSGTATFSF